MSGRIESRLSSIETDLEKRRERETDAEFLDDSGDVPSVVHVTKDLHAWFPGPGREDTDLASLPRYADHFPIHQPNIKDDQ